MHYSICSLKCSFARFLAKFFVIVSTCSESICRIPRHKKHTSSQQSWRTKSKARQRNKKHGVCVFVCNKQHNTKWSDRITINELQWCNKSARQSFLCYDGFVQANVRNCCTLFLNFKSALCKLICRSFLWVRVFCVRFIFGIAINRFSIPLQSSQFRILHVARVILEKVIYSRIFFLLERTVRRMLSYSNHFS